MPVANCPPEIRQLMTVPVTWEGFIEFDGHGDPSYHPAITLHCWQEAFGTMSVDGGLGVFRRADQTVVQPLWDLFFPGDYKKPRSFELYDRFTPGGVGTSSAQSLQALRINTMYGPPFDSRYPWLVVVTV